MTPAKNLAGAFISINPEAGFPLDPFLVSVQAGGPVTASTLSEACQGYISEAPVVTADYQGEADLLKVFFYSDSNTTLVVQTPDGDYLCNDDTSALLLDPTVVDQRACPGPVQRLGRQQRREGAGGRLPGLHEPRERGRTYAGAGQSGETPGHARSAAAARPGKSTRQQRLEDALAAVKSPEALEAGGDDVTVEITAEGKLPAPELQTDDTLCNGLVSLVAELCLRLDGRDRCAQPVRGSRGRTPRCSCLHPTTGVLCNDDSDGADNLNPLVTIEQPAEGRYLVWVGRLNPDEAVTGVLTISEAADAQPEALQP